MQTLFAFIGIVCKVPLRMDVGAARESDVNQLAVTSCLRCSRDVTSCMALEGGCLNYMCHIVAE